MEICHQVHSARITSIKYREQIPLNTTKIGFSGSPKHFSLFFFFFLTLLINQLHQRNSNHLITNSISVPVLMREKKIFPVRYNNWRDLFAASASSVQAALARNNLPPYIRHSSCLSHFRTSLTTSSSHSSKRLLQPSPLHPTEQFPLTVQKCSYNLRLYIRQSSSLYLSPVSYTHLTLPTTAEV